MYLGQNRAYQTNLLKLYRSIKKLFHYAIFQKKFPHFFRYINGLSFTSHVIKLSCNFVSINHINV